MAGHKQLTTIQYRKNAHDVKRDKLFTRLIDALEGSDDVMIVVQFQFMVGKLI